MNNKTQIERIEIVNQIIKAISELGRRFFYNENSGLTARLSVKKGKVYYNKEYDGELLCINTPDNYPPKNWSRGGTIWGLVKDFRDYIEGEDDTNGKHGYGGLFCPHWGYSDEDMKAIREKAFELGYLIYSSPYRYSIPLKS